METFLVGLAVWAITSPLSYLIGRARDLAKRQKRWARRTMYPANIGEGQNQIVLPSSMHRRRELPDHTILHLPLRVMGWGDGMAFGYLYSLFTSIRIQADISFHDTENLTKNIFCIGGPAVNRACERALTRVSDSIEFDMLSGTTKLVDKRKNKVYALVDGRTDYGLILKVRNPAKDGRIYLCLAGIGNEGTAGAAYYFSHRLEEFARHPKNLGFVAIVEVDIPHTATSAKMVDWFTVGV